MPHLISKQNSDYKHHMNNAVTKSLILSYAI